MQKIKLFTEQGQYVTTVLIPLFQTQPKAILWGQRLFSQHSDDEYRECFWIAAVIAGDQVQTIENEMTQAKPEAIKGTEAGNDDLLFGLPSNLEEAVETFIDFFKKAEDFDQIVEMNEDKFIAFAHHGAGQFIRNSWYLWWHEGHGYKEWPKTKPPLVQWFNEQGIFHADDMSGIIISSAYRAIHKKPLELANQVKHYIDFWKKQGYKDGNPMNQQKQ